MLKQLGLFGFGGSSMVTAQSAGLAYLLLDKFITALTAGNIDGTSPEPGPGGTRDVTDAGGDMTIASKKLTFAGGPGTGLGGNGIKWGGITRTLGRALVFKDLNLASATTGFGFRNADTLGAPIAGFKLAGTVLQAYVTGVGAWTLLYAPATSTAYSYAIILRATGAFYFIKGGAWTKWTLVWIDLNDTTATLYPSIGNDDGVFTVDKAIISKRLQTPLPRLSDGFSSDAGPDGLGHAEGVGGTGLSYEGGAGANFAVAEGKIGNTPDDTGADLVTNGDFSAWTADDPDDWTVYGESGSDPEISEVGTGEGHGGAGTGSLNIYTSSVITGVLQHILTLGKWYRAFITISNLASGALRVYMGGTRWINTLGATGYVTGLVESSDQFVLERQGTCDVTIDEVTVHELSFADLIHLVDGGQSDIIAEVEITISNGLQAGIVLQCDSPTAPQNYIHVYLAKNKNGVDTISVDKVVGGVRSDVDSNNITYGAGNKLYVYRVGNSLDVYYNGTQLGTTLTISDAGIVNNTYHGIFSTDPSAQLDNLHIWGATDPQWEALLDEAEVA